MATRYPFAFETRYQVAGLLFGITPTTAEVVLDDDELRARFGPWRVATPRTNVAGAELSGPFGFAKTAGPAHLSFADRGLTMATNGRQGVCIRFHSPIKGIEPTGRLRHPGLTVTVTDCEGLREALTGP